MSNVTASATTETDVLIVGAGVGGLYTAFRMVEGGVQKRIDIVEALHRVGGRLDTDVVKINGVEVKTEEGGMRFTDAHRELLSLIRTVGLESQIVDFPMGNDNNIYYLRGQRFTFGAAKQDPSIWGRLYFLSPTEQGKQPGDILQDVLKAVLIENDQDPSYWQQPTPDDWTRLRLQFTHKGVELYRWGLWAMLRDFGLTEDCIQMLYESSGFIAPYLQEVNAGCALQLLVDFVDPHFHTLVGGYELLPETLANRVQTAGVAIHLGHFVSGIKNLSDGRLEVTTQTADGEVVFVCSELILAVTQLALQEMQPHVPFFRDNATFLKDLNSVTDMALSKINLYYTQRWWTDKLKLKSGGSFTDLPLAQFYCFPEESADGPGSITIYTDYYRSNYWSMLQQIGEPFTSDLFLANPPHTVAATTAVVQAATLQMKEMFALTEIPAPVLTTYKRWTDPSMGDGDHQWAIGVNDLEVRARITNPFPHVYICGETYSDDQAWVNGTLRSVNQMLSAHFKLMPSSDPLRAKAQTT